MRSKFRQCLSHADANCINLAQLPKEAGLLGYFACKARSMSLHRWHMRLTNFAFCTAPASCLTASSMCSRGFHAPRQHRSRRPRPSWASQRSGHRRTARMDWWAKFGE